jgi:hypothetical protein
MAQLAALFGGHKSNQSNYSSVAVIVLLSDLGTLMAALRVSPHSEQHRQAADTTQQRRLMATASMGSSNVAKAAGWLLAVVKRGGSPQLFFGAATRRT